MMARPIPGMVRRIVPSLGSSIDGEALAAARAIGRALHRDGLDFHDLAAAIPMSPVIFDEQSRALGGTPAATAPEFHVYAWRRVYTPRQEAQHRARVTYCLSQRGRLTLWERGFVDNVVRLHGNLSIRQGDRLAGIVDRLEWEARAC